MKRTSCYNRLFNFFFLLIPLTLSLSAQESLPTVYKLGEYETALEEEQGHYPQTLLDACNGDMQKAFELWLGFLKELEAFAKQSGCELEGSSIWLQVFFQADGSISHIGYYPKPNSRVLDDEAFKKCLESFAATYHMPLDSKQSYYNYTDARFPLIYELYDRQ